VTRLVIILALVCTAACRTSEAPASASAGETGAAIETPVLASDCPPDAGTNDEIAAQAAALIPLKTGLTLSTTWHRATEGDDVECLTQIHDIGGTAVAATANCSMSTGTQGGSRRTCRADMRSAHMYYTGAGDDPDVLRGTTMFMLSRDAFGELKSKGSTRHRFVSVSDGKIIGDLDGTLERQSTGTLATVVNDRVVDLAVIRAAGKMRGTAMGKPIETRVTAAVVDDERFPLVLDYALPDVGAAGFSVRYSKVSFPTEGQIEKELAADQRIDVYGIYFDVNSDRLRSESDPILQEIAGALDRNRDWQITIDGHTDSIGNADANMDLSQRRSESVRMALVNRFGVAAARLTTRGRGATVPKDTNDTPEGRARNRRVELVRR
jgi:outer membrane protein OmpA-like peptidoglycan-associated protein